MMKNIAKISGTIERTGEKFFCKGEEFERVFVHSKRISGVVDRVSVVIPVVINTDSDKAEFEGELRMREIINEQGKRCVDVFIFATKVNKYSGEDVNKISIDGVIVINKGIRTTPKGKTIVDLVIVNNKIDRHYYIPCICWARKAIIANDMPVGTNVTVFGRFQSREYIKTHEDGTKEVKTAYELSCMHIVSYESEE